MQEDSYNLMNWSLEHSNVFQQYYKYDRKIEQLFFNLINIGFVSINCWTNGRFSNLRARNVPQWRSWHLAGWSPCSTHTQTGRGNNTWSPWSQNSKVTFNYIYYMRIKLFFVICWNNAICIWHEGIYNFLISGNITTSSLGLLHRLKFVVWPLTRPRKTKLPVLSDARRPSWTSCPSHRPSRFQRPTTSCLSWFLLLLRPIRPAFCQLYRLV